MLLQQGNDPVEPFRNVSLGCARHVTVGVEGSTLTSLGQLL
jgi:hypothetical protein